MAVILCGAASAVLGGSGHKGFFLFVSILALIITFVLIIIMLLNVQAVLLRGRWPLIVILWNFPSRTTKNLPLLSLGIHLVCIHCSILLHCKYCHSNNCQSEWNLWWSSSKYFHFEIRIIFWLIYSLVFRLCRIYNLCCRCIFSISCKSIYSIRCKRCSNIWAILSAQHSTSTSASTTNLLKEKNAGLICFAWWKYFIIASFLKMIFRTDKSFRFLFQFENNFIVVFLLLLFFSHPFYSKSRFLFSFNFLLSWCWRISMIWF